MFHSSLEDLTKTEVLVEYKKEESKIRILFCTIAFGLGVQIDDIRLIIHWGAAKSILSYWQEVGRGGRDHKSAVAICYAYGRSLVKHLTDENMINLCRCTSLCIRKVVLDTITCKGIKEAQEQTCTCSLLCGCEPCTCNLCMCCAFCASKCKCLKKFEDIRARVGLFF